MNGWKANLTYETLLWEIADDGLTTLTLNPPEALNAFKLTMARELEQVFLQEARDEPWPALEKCFGQWG